MLFSCFSLSLLPVLAVLLPAVLSRPHSNSHFLRPRYPHSVIPNAALDLAEVERRGKGRGKRQDSTGNSTVGLAENSSTTEVQYFYGANSYYLYSFPDNGREQILDALQQAGMKTVRIFIEQIAANNKGSSNFAVNDLEPNEVGTYDDTILEQIDQLMADASSRGMKLIIALHDRYSLGFFETDAYATQFGIAEPGSTGAQQISNASSFYTDQQAIDDFDNRIAHIMTHQNAQMGNKTWAQLSEAIYAIEPENEPMGHMDLVAPNWVCDRAQVIKNYTQGSGILVSSGGGTTAETSLQSWAEDCSDIDVIAVHDYSTNASSLVGTLKPAFDQYKAQGRTVLLEEWGMEGDDKAADTESFVEALKAQGVPWMYWEVTNPGANASNFEVWITEPSWSKLTAGGDPPSSEASALPAGTRARARRSEASKRNSTPSKSKDHRARA